MLMLGGLFTFIASVRETKTFSRYVARIAVLVPGAAVVWGISLAVLLPDAGLHVWAISGALTAHWFFPRYFDPPLYQWVSASILFILTGLTFLVTSDSFVWPLVYFLGMFGLSLWIWPRPYLNYTILETSDRTSGY